MTDRKQVERFPMALLVVPYGSNMSPPLFEFCGDRRNSAGQLTAKVFCFDAARPTPSCRAADYIAGVIFRLELHRP